MPLSALEPGVPPAGEDQNGRKRLRLIAASAFEKCGPIAYCEASLPDFWAAISRSITVRQPVLRSARCLNMQAVIFGMFGISELHRRNASPVHIDWASALKAKLEVDETAEQMVQVSVFLLYAEV